jgi:hypothetical protein
VGRGEVDAEAAARLLGDEPDRPASIAPAALTAPAAGLFLEHVSYRGDRGPGPIRPLISIEP